MELRASVLLVVYTGLLNNAAKATVVGVCPVDSDDPRYEYDGDVLIAAPGTILTVTCREKYVPGKPTIKCIQGQWTDPEPPCELIDCWLPHVPDIAYMNMACRNLGCVTTYGCPEGYWYNGTVTRVCQRNGTWSGGPGECEAVFCPSLPDPPNGKILQTDRSYGANATMVCNEGYSHNDPNSSLLYCLNDRTWSRQDSECEAVQCPILPSLNNGKILQTNRSYQAEARILCDEGYVFTKPDSVSRQCQGDNTWSGEDGICTRRSCRRLPNVPNGILSSEEGSYEDIITVQCIKGYDLDGPGTIKCQADGNWTAELGICTTQEINENSVGLNIGVLFTAALVNGMLAIIGIIYVCYRRKICRRCRQQPTMEQPMGRNELEVTPLVAKGISHLYCSFMLQVDLTAVYGDRESFQMEILESVLSEQITSALTIQLGIDISTTITHICLQNRIVFLVIESCGAVEEKDVETVMRDLVVTVRSSERQAHHLVPNSIVFRDKVQHYLVAGIYRKRHVTDKRLDKSIDLDKQYVQLRLLANKKLGTIKRDALERPDLYQMDLEKEQGSDIKDEDLIKAGDYQKYIVIRGRAGIGKSTLVQRLIWKWATGHWAPNFKALFLFNLRYLMTIETVMNFATFLSRYNIYNNRMAAGCEIDTSWVEENEANIGIILDGIDEIQDFKSFWQSKHEIDNINTLAKPKDWCFNLLKRTCLQKTTLAITSRPFTDLRVIEKKVKDVQPVSNVELMGLTREHVFEFVDKNVPKDRTDFVKKTLISNPILLSVCSITFYCAVLCNLLANGDVDLPSKLTTYTQITAYILQMYIHRSLGPTSSSFIEDIGPHLRLLSKLAFHGIVHQGTKNLARLIFDLKDFEQLDIKPEEVTTMRNTGLLIQSEIEDPENSTKTNVFSQFFHLSIQEFLAMAGLLNHTAEDLKKHVRRMIRSEQFNMSLVFLYGLAFDKGHETIRDIAGAIIQSPEELDAKITVLKEAVLEVGDDLQALQIAHESQSIEIVEGIAGKKFNEKISISGTKLTIIDVTAMTFLLTHGHSAHTIELQRVGMDLLSVKELAQCLRDCKSVKTLKIYETGERDFDDNCAKELMANLKYNVSVQNIELISSSMTDEGLHHVAMAMVAKTDLRHLTLDCDKATDKGVGYLTKSLKGNTELQKLSLSFPNMTGNGVADIITAMKNEKCGVNELSLCYDKLEDEDATCVRDSFQGESTIQHLRIICGDITDKGFQQITAFLRMNNKLESISFQISGISSVGVKHVAEAIKTNNTLKEMRLLGFHIEEEGAKALLEVLLWNKTIKIWIWRPCFNSEVVQSLEKHEHVKVIE